MTKKALVQNNGYNCLASHRCKNKCETIQICASGTDILRLSILEVQRANRSMIRIDHPTARLTCRVRRHIAAIDTFNLWPSFASWRPKHQCVFYDWISVIGISQLHWPARAIVLTLVLPSHDYDSTRRLICPHLKSRLNIAGAEDRALVFMLKPPSFFHRCYRYTNRVISGLQCDIITSYPILLSDLRSALE